MSDLRPKTPPRPFPGEASTVPPPFDPARFAREVDATMRGRTPALPTPVPGSKRDVHLIDEPLEGAERELSVAMEASARRTELLGALLSGGALSKELAARALVAELAGIERAAAPAHSEIVASFAASMRGAIAALGGVAAREERAFDVLVLDDNEVTRDLIALAVESQGHLVRAAASLQEFVRLFHARRPTIILTEAQLPDAPRQHFCRFLRESVGGEFIPIVLFANADGAELEAIAKTAGAERFLSKDRGVEGLIAELCAMFDEIVW